MATATIQCAYCLDRVTIEIHPSIIEKYGPDYTPTRCAKCDYIKTRRAQVDTNAPVCLNCGKLLRVNPRTGEHAPCRPCLDSIGDSLRP